MYVFEKPSKLHMETGIDKQIHFYIYETKVEF